MSTLSAKTLMVRFGRIYNFTAAHRLHNHTLSDAENKKVYGKCNNPAGHGHNYKVTVIVEGTPHPQTGMIINMIELDQIADEILAEYSYHHLDREMEVFRNIPSTAENIVNSLWQRFATSLTTNQRARLYRIELSETRNNACELTLAIKGAQ